MSILSLPVDLRINLTWRYSWISHVESNASPELQCRIQQFADDGLVALDIILGGLVVSRLKSQDGGAWERQRGFSRQQSRQCMTPWTFRASFVRGFA